jgi:hypothetical protein
MNTASTPITVSKGYQGDPNLWCFWESEYADEGSFGPYDSKQAVLDAVKAYAVETGESCHVDALFE